MRYLISVIHDKPGLANPEEQTAIKGHWVFAGGLAAPGTATVIEVRPFL